MEKEILIINSRLTTYNFEDGRNATYNRVTFAFRDDLADKEQIGFNNILTCSLDPSSFEITKNIKPNQLVRCTLGLKRAENNTFKYTITRINNVEV